MSRFRPSPALVVAVVALFAALGGAAYAGSKIGTDDIDNGAVTAKKLAKGAVTKRAIARDAVTGKAVKESSLKTVPSAATAGGLTPTKFSARGPAGTQLATIATVGTLKLQFGCSSGQPQVTVLPANGAQPQTTRASVMLNDDDTRTRGQGTLPGAGIVVLDGTDSAFSYNGTIESLTIDGDVTTIQWSARSTSAIPSPNPDEANCLFWGTALAG